MSSYPVSSLSRASCGGATSGEFNQLCHILKFFSVDFFLCCYVLLCVFSRIRVALTIWIHCVSLGVRADSHKRAIRFLANYRSLVRAMSTEGRYESSSRLPSKHTSGSSSS